MRLRYWVHVTINYPIDTHTHTTILFTHNIHIALQAFIICNIYHQFFLLLLYSALIVGLHDCFFVFTQL